MLSKEFKTTINNLLHIFHRNRGFDTITILEQISYLLIMRQLEEDEKSVNLTEKSISTFDGFEEFRWSYFSSLDPNTMFEIVSNKVFPFIQNLKDQNDFYQLYMKDAKFEIKNASFLSEVINEMNVIFDYIKEHRINGQTFQNSTGFILDYLITEIDSLGKNGHFHTPRNLVSFICELMEPEINDCICDPVCGSGGFLLGSYQYIRDKQTKDERIKNAINDSKALQKITNIPTNGVYYGYEINQQIAKICSINLRLNGLKNTQIENLDVLSKSYDDKHIDDKYSLIFAHPPFGLKVYKNESSTDLDIKSTSGELLFLKRIFNMLQYGGRAAIIIPDRVLNGINAAQKQIREALLKENILNAVISLPTGIFSPFTKVKCSILIFTKSQEKHFNWSTEKVWYYGLENDGYSLDDERRKLAENPLPVALNSFKNRAKDTSIERTNNFYVPLSEILDNELDLSYNRYKKFELEEKIYEPPKTILEKLFQLESEIQQDMQELKNLIG